MPRKTTHAPPPPGPGSRARAKGAGGGTPADRLIRAWLDGDRDGFEDLAEELIAGGRDGVPPAPSGDGAEGGVLVLAGALVFRTEPPEDDV